MHTIMSVCSDKLMRTTLWPDALAMAMQSEVLPTPGLPSSRMGLCSCRPRSTRMTFLAVVGACRAKSSLAGTACAPFLMVNGQRGRPNLSPLSIPSSCPASSCCCCCLSYRWMMPCVRNTCSSKRVRSSAGSCARRNSKHCFFILAFWSTPTTAVDGCDDDEEEDEATRRREEGP